MSNIGKQIRAVRKVRGMSCHDLADKISEILNTPISEASVSSWERGDRRIFADQLSAVSKVLHAPVCLFTGDCSEEESDLIESVKAFSDHHKDIVKYACLRWDGDKDALIEFVALYMKLPKSFRREISGMGIILYELAERAEQVIQSGPSPDMEYIENHWKKLFKK